LIKLVNTVTADVYGRHNEWFSGDMLDEISRTTKYTFRWE